MSQENLKQMSAEAALKYVQPEQIVGVGTGSTVEFFIRALASSKLHIKAAIASSERTKDALLRESIPVWDTDQVEAIDIYIDGADEVNPQLQLIKGGGGALTREKILAEMSKTFVCIVDQSKWVEQLGRFPLPVEVIPMAQGLVAQQMTDLGGVPTVREGFVTDNGNAIIDVSGLHMTDPLQLETRIESIPGVVTAGLFVRRPADIVLMGSGSDRVETFP